MSSAELTTWPDEVRAVYVLCHPIKEKARWERLLPHLLARGVPANRIRVCAPTWGSELKAEEIFRVYDPFLKRATLPTFTFKGAGLTRGEISLGLNFGAAVADCTQRGDEGLVITLESDVWLREDFVPRLRELIASAAAVDLSGSTWSYISLGEGVGTRPPGAPLSYYAPTRAYKPPHSWVFRCTDSMLFTTDFFKKLVKTYIPFKEIIDWEMNFQIALNGGKALWADPPIAEQGTWNNRLMTSLPA